MVSRLPSLSVVIPTRDTRVLTLRCLAALAASQTAPMEILLVDDGSRDGSAEAIREAFPAVRIVRRESPGGFTAAVNEAWPLAAGDVVLLLNSDTEVGADATSGFAESFAADSRLGIAGASLLHPDGRPQWSSGPDPDARWLFVAASGVATVLGKVPGWRRIRRESQTDGDAAWVPATAMAVAAGVPRDIGYFDTRFGTYAQDLDYCGRARAAGWRVAQLRAVHVTHVMGATIGAGAGAVVARWAPEAFVADLERWIRKGRPAAEARSLARALEAGLRARLLARSAARIVRRPATRAAWDRDTAHYRAALDHLRRCQYTPE